MRPPTHVTTLAKRASTQLLPPVGRPRETTTPKVTPLSEVPKVLALQFVLLVWAEPVLEKAADRVTALEDDRAERRSVDDGVWRVRGRDCIEVAATESRPLSLKHLHQVARRGLLRHHPASIPDACAVLRLLRLDLDLAAVLDLGGRFQDDLPVWFERPAADRGFVLQVLFSEFARFFTEHALRIGFSFESIFDLERLLMTLGACL